MTATADTIKKINALNDNNYTIIVDLVNYLSASQSLSAEGLDIFHAVREEAKKSPMTEDEVDAFVSSVRNERNASRN